MPNNYSTVTALPSSKGSVEQLRGVYNSYTFATKFCEGKDVLEVACGSGYGLGYLAQKAKKVVGGDVDNDILKYAKNYYINCDNIYIHLLDAHKLPFEHSYFDVIILYEAIYYLECPEKFIKEALRVLRPGGNLIISSVNKDWADFSKSPFSYKYFSIPELFDLLKEHGFQDIKFFGDSPVLTKSFKDKIISFIKRMAIKLHLIPKTMKGKEFFKRIFTGKLLPFPTEIKEGMFDYFPPVSIPCNSPNHQYKVFFAVAYKR